MLGVSVNEGWSCVGPPAHSLNWPRKYVFSYQFVLRRWAHCAVAGLYTLVYRGQTKGIHYTSITSKTNHMGFRLYLLWGGVPFFERVRTLFFSKIILLFWLRRFYLPTMVLECIQFQITRNANMYKFSHNLLSNYREFTLYRQMNGIIYTVTTRGNVFLGRQLRRNRLVSEKPVNS